MRSTKLVSSIASAALLFSFAVAAPASATDNQSTSPTISSQTRTPLNGNVLLAWEPVEGAGRYRVEVYTAPNGGGTKVYSTETTALHATPTSSLNAIDATAATFYWRVGAIVGSAANPAEWSEDFSFERDSVVATTGAYAPTGTVNYPSDNLRFSWPTTVGAKGYKLEYATNSALSGAKTVRTTATSFSPTEPINRLDGSSALTYYWKVSPLDGTQASSKLIANASALKTFNVAWPNSKPTLTYPAHNAYLNDLEFKWTAVPGAKSYKISLRETETGPVVYSASVPGTSYAPSELRRLASYWWSVTPYDANEQAGQSSDLGLVTHEWTSNPEAVADLSADPTRPSPRTSATGINWALGSNPNNPIEVTFEDLQLAWTPLTRAGYYQVDVSQGFTSESSDITWAEGKHLTCLTPNTEVSPSFDIKKATGANARPGNFQGLSTNCLMANINPTNAQNLKVGQSYGWRVRGYDSNAAQATPTSNSAEFIESGWSEPVYFKLVVAPSPRSVTELRITSEAPSIVEGSPHITSTAPLLEWPSTGRQAYKVTIRLASLPNNTEVVTAYTFGANSLRLNGILADVTVGQPYRWTVAGCTWNGQDWGCDIDPEDSDEQGKPGRFTKQEHKLQFLNSDGTAPVASTSDVHVVSADNFKVSWQPYWAAGQSGVTPRANYPASAGYYVQIKPRDNPSEIALEQSVEHNSWQYGEIGETYDSVPKLDYDRDYVLKVAPLDAYGNVGTLNDGIVFRFAEPSEAIGQTAISADSVVFSWPEISAAKKYRVVFAPTNGGAETNVNGDSSTKPSLPQRNAVVALPSEGDYNWWLQTIDRNGNISSKSEQQSFTVSRTSGKPQLLTPSSSVLTPNNRILAWNPVVDASSYEVFVAKNSSAFGATGVKTTATQYAPNGTVEKYSAGTSLTYASGLYKWRVRAYNAAGKVVAESSENTFSVVSAPSKPLISNVRIDGTSATVLWTPLTGGNRGSSAAVSYTVQSRVVAFPEKAWSTVVVTSANAASHQILNLSRNTDYEFRINAVSPYGVSEWSAVKKIKIQDVPSAPIFGNPVARKDGLSVSWSRGVGAAVDTYEVKYRLAGTSSWTAKQQSSSSLSISGLKSGAIYQIEVRGKNASGLGPSASTSVKTLAVPSMVSIPSVKAGNARATVTWKAPAAGTSAITSYTVQKRYYNSSTKKWTSWGRAGTTSKTTLTVQRLTNGVKYEFRVAAVSKVGTGVYSTARSAMPAGKPSAATPKAKSSKRKQIKVTWSGAKANGSKITKHVVQVSTNKKKWKTVKTAKASSKSYTWKKASAGKRYYVRVLTYNKLGKATSRTTQVVVKK